MWHQVPPTKLRSRKGAEPPGARGRRKGRKTTLNGKFCWRTQQNHIHWEGILSVKAVTQRTDAKEMWGFIVHGDLDPGFGGLCTPGSADLYLFDHDQLWLVPV